LNPIVTIPTVLTVFNFYDYGTTTYCLSFFLWLTAIFRFLRKRPAIPFPPKARFPLKSFIVPATLIGGGAALLGHPTRAPFDEQRQQSVRWMTYLRFRALRAAGGATIGGR
jgi:hypothetical protein